MTTSSGRLKISISLLFAFAVLHIINFTMTILENDSLVSRKNDRDELVMNGLVSSPPGGDANPYDKQKYVANTPHSTTDTVKIVAFTDLDYIPVAKWWYERMTSLGYNTHVIVVIDHEAQSHFQNINKHNYSNYYRFETKIVDPGKRRKNKVRSLWYNRILYCLTELKRGQSLLLTDVDNIFSKYEPLSQYLESNYDAIYALEGKFPPYVFKKQGFVVCGGLIFLRASNATIQIMEMLLDRCDGGTKRCDDQVEWNKLLAEVVTWNIDKSSMRNKTQDGLLQYGFEGVSSTVKGFKAKVWDRDFAWRGPFDTEYCPSEQNWVSMPGNLPFHVQQKLETVSHGVAKNIGLEKMARVILWEAFCGVNGTNRDRKQRIRDRLDKALAAFGERQSVKLQTK